MKTQRIVFRNDSGGEASGLRAMFSPSRTSLLGYRAPVLPKGAAIVAAGVNLRAAELLWVPPIPPGARVTLSVSYLGEPFGVQELAWRDAGGTLHAQDATPTPEMVLLLGAASIEDLATRTPEIDAIRSAVVAQIGDPKLKSFHEFFCELDSETNPQLMPNVSKATAFNRGPIIRTIAEDLMQRVLQRARWAATNKTTPAEDLRVTANRTNIERISSLQLDIIEHHFGKPGEGFAAEHFWEAFAAFANGELKVSIETEKWQDWDAAPRSAFAFSFAEFAFMAVDTQVHDDRWAPLIWPLVAMQEVYTAAFRPRKGDPKTFRFGNYQLRNYGKGENRMSGDAKQKVRKSYEGREGDLDQLRIQAGLNAFQAFPAGE